MACCLRERQSYEEIKLQIHLALVHSLVSYSRFVLMLIRAEVCLGYCFDMFIWQTTSE